MFGLNHPTQGDTVPRVTAQRVEDRVRGLVEHQPVVASTFGPDLVQALDVGLGHESHQMYMATMVAPGGSPLSVAV